MIGPAAAYLAEHAIDPAVAEEVGVRVESDALIFPGGRVRSLNGAGPEVRQPKGRPLGAWWPKGRPAEASVVLVTEGESDCLAAVSWLPATPECAGLRALPVVAIPGTGFPVGRLVEEMREVGAREVVLALDADDAGRSYVDRAAAALREQGIRPVPLELREGFDLAAWLAAIEPSERGEHFASALVDAEAAATPDGADGERPEWTKRQPLDLDPDAEPEPPDYLVAGRIERGAVTVLAGDTGAAKSWLAGQALPVAIVEGADRWLGYRLDVRHRSAVVIDEENPERLVRARLRALGLTAAGASRLRYFHRMGVRLGEGDWIEWMRFELDRQPADVLVIDTGTAATAPDPLDNAEVVALYRELRQLAAETGVAIVLLLHERKPPSQGPRGARTMATLGARQWIGQADTQLMLARRGEAVETTYPDGTIALETRFTLEVGKLRDGGAERKEVVRVASTLDSRRALLTAEVESEGDAEPEPTAADQVAALLGATPGLTLDQLRDETGKAERTIRDALRELGAVSEGRPKRWELPSDDQEELLS